MMFAAGRRSISAANSTGVPLTRALTLDKNLIKTINYDQTARWNLWVFVVYISASYAAMLKV
jgi:hypothetical protein